MERFGFTFDFALKRVELSLRFCAILRPLPDTVLYRYEDGFTSNPRIAASLAQVMGIRLPVDRLTKIGRKYHATAVRSYAASLDHLPDLMRNPDNPADAWCPTTQIHRGHIGKLTSGRWRDLPLKNSAAMIDEACGEDAVVVRVRLRGIAPRINTLTRSYRVPSAPSASPGACTDRPWRIPGYVAERADHPEIGERVRVGQSARLRASSGRMFCAQIWPKAGIEALVRGQAVDRLSRLLPPASLGRRGARSRCRPGRR